MLIVVDVTHLHAQVGLEQWNNMLRLDFFIGEERENLAIRQKPAAK